MSGAEIYAAVLLSIWSALCFLQAGIETGDKVGRPASIVISLLVGVATALGTVFLIRG